MQHIDARERTLGALLFSPFTHHSKQRRAIQRALKKSCLNGSNEWFKNWMCIYSVKQLQPKYLVISLIVIELSLCQAHKVKCELKVTKKNMNLSIMNHFRLMFANAGLPFVSFHQHFPVSCIGFFANMYLPCIYIFLKVCQCLHQQRLLYPTENTAPETPQSVIFFFLHLHNCLPSS